MSTIRKIDPKGRVILPSKIRKALNLQPGKIVEIEVQEDGTIKVRPVEVRGSEYGNTSRNT